MTPIWWLLAFPPVLLLLYFLKLKRQQHQISSTMLWRRSLEDLHVNAPFQRLRKSILLLLQMLILFALIASLWRPRCNHEDIGGEHMIVLIDVSASMNAKEGDETRLEFAKKEVLKVISAMTPNSRMMLLTFAERVITLQPLTSDRALLESKVESIQGTSLSTDIVSALSSAHSIAESLPSARILVLGDSCYPDLGELRLEVKRENFEFFGKSSPQGNLGITEADVRRSLGRVIKTEAFAFVRNHSDTAREVTLSLHHGDTLIDAKPMTIEAGSSNSSIFDVTDLSAGLLKLSIDSEDALEDDNQVWIDLAPPREISVVIVGEENTWLDYALRSAPNFYHERLSKTQFLGAAMKKRLESNNPPIVVYDRWLPEIVPDVPSIFVGVDVDRLPIPDGLEKPTALENQRAIDWDHVHPINRDIAFDDVGTEKAFVFADQRSEYYRTLVDSAQGSMIGILYRDAATGGLTPSVYVGFDVEKSNWPLGHFSFPIFFSNAVKWLGTRYGDSKTRWSTGDPIVYTPRTEPGAEVVPRKFEFITPSGESVPAVTEKNGSLVFGQTDRVGVYELRADGELLSSFGVALLDDEESLLTPETKIDFGDYERTVGGEIVAQTQDLWSWFALGAIALMILEWYVFHRRVYV